MTPVISFEPSLWGAPQTHDELSAISSGRYDQYFRRWGHDAARWGKTVIFCFGFEMNGNWFSWGQQPKRFKSAWRRIHRLFKQAGASNVKWMFSPNVAPLNADGRQNPLTYYQDFAGIIQEIISSIMWALTAIILGIIMIAGIDGKALKRFLNQP